MSTAQPWRGAMLRHEAGPFQLPSLAIQSANRVGPAGVVALHALFDWRTIWIILPASALILVAPFLRQLTRRTALQDGEGIDGIQATDQTKDNANQTSASDHWRRRDVLVDPRFWLAILWLVAVPSFVLTGLLFHQLF